MKLRVAQARYTTPDVLHLTLVHPRKPELPVWAPGAHVDLRIPDGRVRQYSLCGDPADRTRYDIAIKREETGRGASLWAHANLTLGAIAHISAPRNNFPLAEGACRHVLVAGGIGITPFQWSTNLQTSGRILNFISAHLRRLPRHFCRIFACFAASACRRGSQANAAGLARRQSDRPATAAISMYVVRSGS